MADHIADAGKKVPGLRGWPIESLRYELRLQIAPGVSTWGPGICGHNARGSGYCADCLRAEIGRREDGR